MASIDFRGREGALGAYENAAIETWAVFNKKNIMQSGEGLEALTGYLDLMEQHGGNTVYTMKLYKNVSADDIVENTPCNSSFNFNLIGGGMGMVGYSGGGAGNSFALMQKIANLEAKLKDAEKDTEKKTIGSTMLGWIENVDDIVKLAGVIGMFMGKTTAEQNMKIVSQLAGLEQPKREGTPAAGFAAAVQDDPGGEIEITEEQGKALIRYAQVIERGEKCDPDFLQHMEQLVLLAETKPDTYKMGLGFLK